MGTEHSIRWTVFGVGTGHCGKDTWPKFYVWTGWVPYKMIDRGGLVGWRLFGQPCRRRKKVPGTDKSGLFCFFVPRVAAPQVFCYLDETIGPKQERKERGPSVERRVCADPEGDL